MRCPCPFIQYHCPVVSHTFPLHCDWEQTLIALPNGLEASIFTAVSAEDAKYGPPTGKQSATAMVLALRVMRMASCCRGSGTFLLRVDFVLRCVHVLGHFLARIVRAAALPKHACVPAGLACIDPTFGPWSPQHVFQPMVSRVACMPIVCTPFWRR